MITIVQNDQGDWMGIYKDGKLLREGHSFSASETLRILGIEHVKLWDIHVPEGEGLPHLISELQFEHGVVYDGKE